MVIFEKPREAMKKFNSQVREVCSLVQGTYDAIVKIDPKRAVKPKTLSKEDEKVESSKPRTPSKMETEQ